MARYPKGTTASMNGNGTTPIGNPKAKYAAQRNPRPAMGPGSSSNTVPKDSHIGALQPKLNPNWHKLVKAWWNALGWSDAARFYQEIDWVNLWIAADVLDQMYNFGFTAGLYKEWQHTVEWLCVPRTDLVAMPEAIEPEDDTDEIESAAELEEIAARLRAV